MRKTLWVSVAMLAIAASGRAARAQAEPPGSAKVVLEPLGDDDADESGDDDAATDTADIERSTESEAAPVEAAPLPPLARPCLPCSSPCRAAPPCSSLPPLDAAELELWQSERTEARNAIVAGALMLALGEAVAVFHALHDPSMHGVELIPVAGPVIGVFNHPPAPEWATPLLIASWLDAAGILTMAVAAAYMPKERHFTIGAASTGRDSRLSFSFTF